jgi:hypothetical protein
MILHSWSQKKESFIHGVAMKVVSLPERVRQICGICLEVRERESWVSQISTPSRSKNCSSSR